VLEDEFRTYGVLKRLWVARKSSGYAFIDFDEHKDAKNAILDLNGKHNWWVELSHKDCDYSDRGSGELGSGSSRRCSRTHPSDRRSPGEHPSLYHSSSNMYSYILS